MFKIRISQCSGSALVEQSTNTLNDHEYYQTRPRKRVGVGALLLSDKHEVLLVKPNYREGWLLPGGSVEANESPLGACIREVQEEVGIELSDPRLLLVEHAGASEGYKGDCLRFIFFGGFVTPDRAREIKLQSDELDEFAFFDLQDAMQHVVGGLDRRLPAAVDALIKGTVVYLEN